MKDLREYITEMREGFKMADRDITQALQNAEVLSDVTINFYGLHPTDYRVPKIMRWVYINYLDRLCLDLYRQINEALKGGSTMDQLCISVDELTESAARKAVEEGYKDLDLNKFMDYFISDQYLLGDNRSS